MWNRSLLVLSYFSCGSKSEDCYYDKADERKDVTYIDGGVSEDGSAVNNHSLEWWHDGSSCDGHY